MNQSKQTMEKQLNKNYGFEKEILGNAVESNVVSAEVSIHGMVHIGDCVFHADRETISVLSEYTQEKC